MVQTLIGLKDIHKSFKTGIQEIQVLKGISFNIEQGDFMVLLGPSGCGKSTLLHILLGLEYPSSGTVTVEDKDFYASGIEDDRSEYRKRHVGMIFQKPNWVQALNVLDNVMFPLMLLDVDKVTAIQRANEVLNRVGMANWANNRPTELSSGQQQKVSLARSIITDPDIIVADEPTGNLDYTSGQELMELFMEMNKQGKTILMVTHDLEYLTYAKTAVQLFNGELVGVFRGKDKDLLSQSVKLKRGVGESADQPQRKPAVKPEQKPDPQPAVKSEAKLHAKAATHHTPAKAKS